jgi:hypothetical protein
MHLRDFARWSRERGRAKPVVRCVRRATLRDFELVWNYRSPVRSGGAANVAPVAGRLVPGVILAVDAATLASLDRKEGHPNRYCRGDAPRPVELAGGGQGSAWVYEVTKAWRSTAAVPPRLAYLNLVVEGARQFGLPEWHIRTLEATPTA